MFADSVRRVKGKFGEISRGWPGPGGRAYNQRITNSFDRIDMQETHAALGGRFMELDGRQVVADYGDPVEEHRRMRETGGIIDRGYRAVISVTGPDREALLQSMTTNDVVKTPVDGAVHDAICTTHGKVQSLFLALKLEDRFLLDMDPAVGSFTKQFLDKYTIIREAATADVTVEWGRIGVYGPLASDTVTAALGIQCGNPGTVTHGPDGVLVVANAEFGVPGFELFVPLGELARRWGDLLAAGEQRGVGPIGFSALESLRIESGRARYGVEVDDSVILLEAGLTDSVAFDKGCFVGQETLSRVVFRGQLSRRLCGLVAGGRAPQPGAVVTDGDMQVGTVKSVAYSPMLNAVVALAFLKRSHWEPGTPVSVEGEPAEVAALPFVGERVGAAGEGAA